MLSLTGDVTASAGVSASYFMGDGSLLTGISAGGGSGDGIFTVIDATHAYVTSSLTIGATTAADHKISISGSLSASINISASAFYGSGIVLAGGLALNRVVVTSHTTASKSDYYFGIDSSGGTIEVQLLDAGTLDNGQTYVFKDEGGAANSNNITILPSGAQTIDGQNSIVLESPYTAISVYCNGNNKYFIC